MLHKEPFSRLTLFFTDPTLEDQYINRERKAINTFAFYSAYSLMALSFIEVAQAFSAFYSSGTGDPKFLFGYLSIALIQFFGETLTFCWDKVKKVRGFFLVCGLFTMTSMQIYEMPENSVCAEYTFDNTKI